MMTMHAAKGLEFDVVLLDGKRVFSHIKNQLGKRSKWFRRRLAYVGITRAKKKWSYPSQYEQFIKVIG